jgi:hypothetical protein
VTTSYRARVQLFASIQRMTAASPGPLIVTVRSTSGQPRLIPKNGFDVAGVVVVASPPERAQVPEVT